jgi:hypothetical protein
MDNTISRGAYQRHKRRGTRRPDGLYLRQSLDVDLLLKILNETKIEGSVETGAQVLRNWAERWIASGYSKGVDSPLKRTIRGCPVLTNGFDGWMLVENDAGNGVCLWFSSDLRLERLRSPSTSEPEVRGDIEVAQHFITRMVLSNIHLNLAKCRNEECGKIFMLDQRNREYRRGTFCDDCKPTAKSLGDQRTVAADRKEATRELRTLAAAKFHKEVIVSRNFPPDPKLVGKIIEYLNGYEEILKLRRGSKKRLSANWITNKKTGHWDGIVKKAREMFAKG